MSFSFRERFLRRPRTTPRNRRHSGTVILSLGMLLLIIAQLSWWLIFFRRNQHETTRLQVQLDRLRIAAANGELSPDGARGGTPGLDSYNDDRDRELGLVLLPNGKYGLSREELERRENESHRAYFMLLSETLFVIVVCSYGTFRVMRTILRERRLRHERQIFIDSVTHELKTPLASILLNLQTILKRKLPDSARDELLEDSITDVRRLEEQLNNILLSGRLGRGEGPGVAQKYTTNAAPPVIDAVAAMREFFQENARRFEQSELRYTLQVPENLYVHADLESFRTILSNLLQNTIQYAGPAGPEILITSSNADPRGPVVLHIRDRGPGIPRAEWENVFKPFYRLHEGQRPVRGSGIGLYLVRELTRAAGGDVRILATQDDASTDNANGSGLLIELRLPRAELIPTNTPA